MEDPAFTLTLETRLGSNIRKSVIEAIRISKLLNVSVSFDFNDQDLTVYPDTDVDRFFELNRKRLRL